MQYTKIPRRFRLINQKLLIYQSLLIYRLQMSGFDKVKLSVLDTQKQQPTNTTEYLEYQIYNIRYVLNPGRSGHQNLCHDMGTNKCFS